MTKNKVIETSDSTSSSRFNLDVEDEFMDDSTEYSEDAPFVGRRRDHPAPLFCVGRDVFVGYFSIVHFVDGDFHLFWVAQAITNLSPDPGYHN